MTLDLHITLGEVITAASCVTSVLAAYFRLSARLDLIEFKVNELWERRAHRRD